MPSEYAAHGRPYLRRFPEDEIGKEDDETVFHLETHPMRIGEYITLTEPDGSRLPFRVTSLIGPIARTVLGSVESSAARRGRWLNEMRRLGTRGG